ncbi:MAG: hypothetical protein K2K60_06510 [Clostridia bacterium]|nr:hypothetical protein [Clostridia bacterium]
MIKSGIKNYFKNLKFYFVPIGALFVGAVIGLSILLPGCISAVKGFVNEITEILKETSIDFNVVKDFILNSVKELDWDKPVTSIKTILSRDWLTSLFNGCTDLVAADLQPYAQQIDAAVKGVVGTVKSLLILFIICCVIGFIGGYFLTGYLVRRDTARRPIWKFLLAMFIDSVITPAILFVCVWLFTMWKPSIIFSTLVALCLFGVISLLSAYLVHGVKKVKFGDVLNAKNILKLSLTNFIIYYISVVFVVLLCVIINTFSGILIGFSFVEIAFLVISINAESYVLGLVPKTVDEEQQPLAA